MTDQMQVPLPDLVAHAGHVDEIGAGLADAHRAGLPVRMAAGVYGDLCQLVPAFLGVLQDEVLDGIAAAATAVHDTAEALRAVAAGYEASDLRAAERLRNAR
ncbi:type VII secretion target [Symbioplanes lichenis]|uniref:type VII secretion target n=1 Tax=Symbioplanes lichenis TaxID=1629072 RepID=UPI00273852CE|nr:type VII secretion target [Actinoplanes lichenis]